MWQSRAHLHCLTLQRAIMRFCETLTHALLLLWWHFQISGCVLQDPLDHDVPAAVRCKDLLLAEHPFSQMPRRASSTMPTPGKHDLCAASAYWMSLAVASPLPISVKCQSRSRCICCHSWLADRKHWSLSFILICSLTPRHTMSCTYCEKKYCWH